MRSISRYASLAAVAAVLATVPGSAQKTTGPKAQYSMDVSTMSGMGMGAMMGGGLGGLMGGGGDNYMLDLKLTSATPSPQQPEKADHFFLPAAKMGKSVPLVGDAPGKPSKPDRDYDPRGMEKPKGRLLMFWGCYTKAPKGQPFIIDFAKLPTAQMPANMPAQMRGMQAAAAARDANAAWWPNGQNGKQPKSGSSLRGEHRVASAYTPEIKFALMNDYMASLKVNPSEQLGAILLKWNSVPTATGYVAWAMGGMERAGQGGDLVMWTSANSKDGGHRHGLVIPGRSAAANCRKEHPAADTDNLFNPCRSQGGGGRHDVRQYERLWSGGEFLLPAQTGRSQGGVEYRLDGQGPFPGLCQLHDRNGFHGRWRRRGRPARAQAQGVQGTAGNSDPRSPVSC